MAASNKTRSDVRRARTLKIPPSRLDSRLCYHRSNRRGLSMLQVQKKKLDSKFIHSMDKGLEVLERVAQGGELPLSDLAHALNWDKSTVFRLLATLMRRGYIEQNPETKRYRLGFRILYLENQLFRALDLPRVCRDTLARLAQKTGESAHLATIQRRQVI